MTPTPRDELERWRDAPPGCPSELELDQLHLGELDAGEAETLRAHVDACDGCVERLALRAEGLDAFPQLDANAIVARLHSELAGTETPPEVERVVRESIGAAPSRASSATQSGWSRFWERLRAGWVPAALSAAAAAALVLVIARPWAGGPDPDGPGDIRLKGAAKLFVFYERAGQVEEALSGAVLAPGDRLRFHVDLPKGGHLMVVGVEASRALYPCYPSDGGRASLPAGAGDGQELPGAVRLDAAPGEEWLHLVLCEAPFALDDVSVPAQTGGLTLPEGCVSTPFQLRKDVPRTP